MIHVSGTSDDAEVVAELVLGVVHDRPVTAALGEELVDLVAGAVAHDRVELGAVVAERTLLLGELDQLGMLADARHAVVGEEVEHDPAALATRQLERRPVGEHARGVGRDVADQRRGGRLLAARVGGEQHDEQREHDDRDAARRCTARRGAGDRRSVAGSISTTSSLGGQPTATSSAVGAPTSGTGADTGIDRVAGGDCPGKAANSVPTAIISPPIQSQTIERLEEHLEMDLAGADVGRAVAGDREVDVAGRARRARSGVPIGCPPEVGRDRRAVDLAVVEHDVGAHDVGARGLLGTSRRRARTCAPPTRPARRRCSVISADLV